MQSLVIIAEGDLFKLIFVGIFIFISLLGPILKKLGFEETQDDGSADRPKGNRPRNANEDMENARRRLQELIRERNGGGSFKPVQRQELPTESKARVKPTPISKPKPVAKKVVEPKANAYHEEAFDYNAELARTEKLREEAMLAYSKVANNAVESSLAEDFIKSTEIGDLMHDKKFLKKSIVISEILDKPLSLR